MSIRFGILTVSDRSSQGVRPDRSGPVLVNEVLEWGWSVGKTAIIPDDYEALVEILKD